MDPDEPDVPSGTASKDRISHPNGTDTRHFRSRILVLGSILATILWIIGVFQLEHRNKLNDLEMTPVRHWSWLISLTIVAAFMLGVGHHVTGHWRSLLIDDRHKISLSRMQLVLWTILVLSAFMNALVWNLVQDDCILKAPSSNPANFCEPLDLTIPEDLLLLMGISTGALIGAKFIKSDQMSDAKLHVNEERSQAQWTDIFRTEGKHDFHSLDLGKLQMFLFTVILVLGYAGVIWTEFAGLHNFDFPGFSRAAVGLLGISQIGYLATKAAQNQSAGSNAKTSTNRAGSDDSPEIVRDDV